MKMLVDRSKCTGCRLCVLVCSLKREGVCNPDKSRIQIERRALQLDLPIVCRQCDQPSCVDTCPQGALRQASSGAIQVDGKLCTACGLCITACPFGAVRIHPSEHVAMICDLCDGDPACVKYCALGALKVK